MKKKTILYLGFFVVLVVAFFLTVRAVIPGFSDSGVPPVSRVQPFRFQNQDGKWVTQEDLKGKVYIANYFFTTCTGICPRMNGNLREIYDEFKDEPDFVIVSHTCDPETDSVAQLKHYSDSMQVDNSHWWFLTGRKDSLYNSARLSYSIDDPKNNLRDINDDFLHTQLVALVNRKGEVKQVYDALQPDEIRQLAIAIRNQLNK